ncbi:MAG: hypothetical protein M1834_006916 [Cirrosporium novae-zelandiae]|nr:MAG: hypothetical protein M1834_006916 [Cirrosporium novae-zelandiae]
MGSVSTPLIDLAEQISASARTISDFLSSKGLPQPSFDKDAPAYFPSTAEVEVLEARRILRETSKKMFDLITGPAESLIWLWFAVVFPLVSYIQAPAPAWLLTVLCHQENDNAALLYISHFKIAEAVPLDDEVTYTDVAAKSGRDEAQLRHILQHAMTLNIFCEPKPGFVAHTAQSKLLLDKSFAGGQAHLSEIGLPSAAKLVESTEKWGASQEKTETAFNVAFNTELPLFGYMAKSPERSEKFSSLMRTLVSSEGYNAQHAVDGFDWKRLGAATVVDVGGSTGDFSIQIANAAPSLTFVIEDLPAVVAQGESLLPSSLKNRISFKAHDFFTPQPIHGADVYFLRSILHMHSDKYALLILENIIPALKSGASLIVQDIVLPSPGTVSPVEARMLHLLDMQMMIYYNAHERSLNEWIKLFQAADTRFKLRHFVNPPMSVLGVMEFVFEDGERTG